MWTQVHVLNVGHRLEVVGSKKSAPGSSLNPAHVPTFDERTGNTSQKTSAAKQKIIITIIQSPPPPTVKGSGQVCSPKK